MSELHNQPWRLDAACRNATPSELELAFSAEDAEQLTFVERFCRSCPVVRACHEDGVIADGALPQGVRGGLTEKQRRNQRRKRARQGWPAMKESA